jgi:hypothetical protein
MLDVGIHCYSNILLLYAKSFVIAYDAPLLRCSKLRNAEISTGFNNINIIHYLNIMFMSIHSQYNDIVIS